MSEQQTSRNLLFLWPAMYLILTFTLDSVSSNFHSARYFHSLKCESSLWAECYAMSTAGCKVNLIECFSLNTINTVLFTVYRFTDRVMSVSLASYYTFQTREDTLVLRLMKNCFNRTNCFPFQHSAHVRIKKVKHKCQDWKVPLIVQLHL